MTSARRKRIEKLEQERRATPAFGALVLPPIETDIDAWSADAMAQQKKLAEATHEGLDRPAVVKELP